MALFYTALFAISSACVTIAVVELISGEGGFVVMFFFCGLLALLTGFQTRHYLRDLASPPIAIDGSVLRKWHKGNLFIFFMPSYYIMVEGQQVFSIPRQDYSMLLEDDVIRVHCYPNSLTVERIERYDSSAKRYIPATDGA